MKLTYLPWMRRCIAASITTIDTLDNTLPARVSFRVGVVGGDAAGLPAEPSGLNVQLYGPGDILGIDPQEIIRIEPERLANDFMPNNFVCIEFDTPDFPWLFTPAVPNNNQQLRPWLCLVVLPKDEKIIEFLPGMPLPILHVKSAKHDLPDLSESWAWAHTQIADQVTSPETLQTIVDTQPESTLSRLICPRKLEAGKTYVACVVPTFAVGVNAGRGITSPDNALLEPAWTEASGAVDLPVYYHWEFSAGEEGDFKALVKRLDARPLDVDTLGGRALTVIGLPDTPARFEGPLGAPGMEGGEPAAATRDKLLQLINESQDPLAPPIYGRWHAGKTEVKAEQPVPQWLYDLNIDVRWRTAAGLGVRVVQEHQEELMDEAWRQVSGILKANQALRQAQLARTGSQSLHTALFTSSPQIILQITAPVHTRVLITVGGQAARTPRQVFADSDVPTALVSSAFRRLARPRGPLSRRIGSEQHWMDVLTLANSGVADYRPFVPSRNAPNGAVSPEDLKRGFFPTSTPTPTETPTNTETPTETPTSTPTPTETPTNTETPTETPTSTETPTGTPTDTETPTETPTSTETPTGTPTDTPMVVTPFAAFTSDMTFGTAPLTVQFTDQSTGNIDAFIWDFGDGGTSTEPDPAYTYTEPGTYAVMLTVTGPGGSNSSASVINVNDSSSTDTGGIGTPIGSNWNDYDYDYDAILKSAEARALADDALARHMARLKAVEPPDREEPPFRALPLAEMIAQLKDKLNPEQTIKRRFEARLDRELTGDDPLEPIMAAPVFQVPAYELLRDLSQELLLPGAENVPPNSVVGLGTNPRAIEAFMVGLNHEMSRELLWREFPTDQRGTYFRYFWDTRSQGTLVPDIPRMTEWLGALGDHMTGGSSQFILLVRGELLRRYPRTVILLAPAIDAAGKRVVDKSGKERYPIFHGTLKPDMTFLGFDLTPDEVSGADGKPGWFVVFQEPPTEMRFGLEAEPQPVDGLDDLSWADVQTTPGGYLKIGANAPTGFITYDPDGTRWGAKTTSARIAHITRQKPFRALRHGSDLLPHSN